MVFNKDCNIGLIFSLVIGVNASVALGGGGIILQDQIGPYDGSMVGEYWPSQIFEDQYSAFDVACIESFENTDGLPLLSVEAVIEVADLSKLQGVRVEVYSSIQAAETSLTGDVASHYQTQVTVDPNWPSLYGSHGLSSHLLVIDLSSNPLVVYPGTNYIAVIPVNDYSENGQTYIGSYLGSDGDGISWIANPDAGYSNWTLIVNKFDHAYRIVGGQNDPCTSALPACPEDINTDGVINVSDLLEIIGNYGAQGDGTFRPVGDIAPTPNGDCLVNTVDLLALINVFGSTCANK